MLIIYSKNGCPNCDKARNMLENYDISFAVIKIDENTEAREFVVGEGHKAVPQMYIGNEYLGGWNQLAAMTREELLDKVEA